MSKPREVARFEGELAEARATFKARPTPKAAESVKKAKARLAEVTAASTRVYRVPGPPDAADVRQRDHFDGRLDARVRPRPVRGELRLNNPNAR